MPQTPPSRRGVVHRGSPTPPAEEDSFARVASFYDELMASIPYHSWADYVEQVMDHYEVRPQEILDVACGTGTVSMILAQRGYQVVGTDLSAPMIKVAQEKAAQAGLELPFHAQDAAAMKFKGKFDLAICLYDSLNYVLEDDHLLAAFKAVRRALRPGGFFFFDLNGLHAFEAELFTQESPPGVVPGYRWQSRFNPFTSIAEVEMHFEPPTGKPFTITHRQRAYLVDEVVELLNKARFEVLNLFEAYTLLPPGRYSERIFYMARKPEARRKKA